MSNNKKNKKPVLSLFLSALLPGLGQVYNGQIQKGIMLAVLNVVINILLKEPLSKFMENGFDIARPTLIVFGGYTIAGMILWVYAMIDAKKYAEYINTKNDAVS